MSPFILLAIGIVLLFFEFYLPGGIVAVAGIIFIIFGFSLLLVQKASILLLTAYVVLATFGVIATIKFALYCIRQSGSKRTFFLESDQEGMHASSFEKETIGKKGEAISDLKPGGYVMIEGKRFQALSLSGYISKGEEIEVVSGQGESLNVKRS